MCRVLCVCHCDSLRAKSKVIWFKSLVTSVVLEEAIFSILASFDVFHFS